MRKERPTPRRQTAPSLHSVASEPGRVGAALGHFLRQPPRRERGAAACVLLLQLPLSLGFCCSHPLSSNVPPHLEIPKIRPASDSKPRPSPVPRCSCLRLRSQSPQERKAQPLCPPGWCWPLGREGHLFLPPLPTQAEAAHSVLETEQPLHLAAATELRAWSRLTGAPSHPGSIPPSEGPRGLGRGQRSW